MSSADNKLAERLVQLLTRLIQGQTLDPDSLAQEFDISRKTIDRDLAERLGSVTRKERDNGKIVYRLENMALSVLSVEDIKRFAVLSGIQSLYPTLNQDFLRDYLAQTSQNNLLIKGYEYEDWRQYREVFQALNMVIVKRQCINFHYKDKVYEQIQPYKLLNMRALWYLSAVDNGKLKNFCLSKILFLTPQKTAYVVDAAIEQQLQQEPTLWYGEEKQQIVLHIDKAVANHFIRRAVLPNQRILSELNDGCLLVESLVVHDTQIMPLVRYWLPHVRIINPEGYQEKLNQQLRDYLEVS